MKIVPSLSLASGWSSLKDVLGSVRSDRSSARSDGYSAASTARKPSRPKMITTTPPTPVGTGSARENAEPNASKAVPIVAWGATPKKASGGPKAPRSARKKGGRKGGLRDSTSTRGGEGAYTGGKANSASSMAGKVKSPKVKAMPKQNYYKANTSSATPKNQTGNSYSAYGKKPASAASHQRRKKPEPAPWAQGDKLEKLVAETKAMDADAVFGTTQFFDAKPTCDLDSMFDTNGLNARKQDFLPWEESPTRNGQDLLRPSPASATGRSSSFS